MQDMILDGRKALVTGAARGIGRGCALELARAGADVAINDREHSAETDSLLAEIKALGRRGMIVDGDVFSRGKCEEIVERTIHAFGWLDILVSNPAYSRRGDFLTFEPETFEKVLQGTLMGGFHMSQLVARDMVKRGRGGKIVFISSVHARVPYAGSVAYNAGKSGLNHMALTKSVACPQSRAMSRLPSASRPPETIGLPRSFTSTDSVMPNPAHAAP